MLKLTAEKLHEGSDFMPTMSTSESADLTSWKEATPTNITCVKKNLSVTTSVISMTVGILSNSLAFFILLKSSKRRPLKSRAPFSVFAASLVVTDLLGHLVNGSVVLYVYSLRKDWEMFDPHGRVCNLFGATLVFFGLSPLFLGSAMAIERCIGVTKPFYHSTGLAFRHMNKLLSVIWLLAALVAALPVVLMKSYKVQRSRSWCFYNLDRPGDRLDVFLPSLFALLGLLALLCSIVCNAVTSCSLLLSTMHRKHHSGGTAYHVEMICQLMAIMLVSCVCWGPLLTRIILLTSKDDYDPASDKLLFLVQVPGTSALAAQLLAKLQSLQVGPTRMPPRRFTRTKHSHQSVRRRQDRSVSRDAIHVEERLKKKWEYIVNIGGILSRRYQLACDVNGVTCANSCMLQFVFGVIPHGFTIK
ncbi:prostaglandin F2-alpha receptor isoform X1 [Vanacampus margaritifer]